MRQIILLFSCAGLLLASETTATYKVEGMMCGVSCPKAIQKSLNGVDGVKICIVDFKSRTTTVTYDAEKIDSEKIGDTIAKHTYFKVTDKNKEKSWSLIGWLFGKSK